MALSPPDTWILFRFWCAAGNRDHMIVQKTLASKQWPVGERVNSGMILNFDTCGGVIQTVGETWNRAFPSCPVEPECLIEHPDCLFIIEFECLDIIFVVSMLNDTFPTGSTTSMTLWMVDEDGKMVLWLQNSLQSSRDLMRWMPDKLMADPWRFISSTISHSENTLAQYHSWIGKSNLILLTCHLVLVENLGTMALTVGMCMP